MANQKLYTNFVNKKPWVDPSVNREFATGPAFPGTNASALFGYELKRQSAAKRAEINQSTESGNTNNNTTAAVNRNNKAPDIEQSGSVNKDSLNARQGNKSDRESYTALERGVYNLREKVDGVDRKVDLLDDGYRAVPSRVGEVETTMAAGSNQLSELEWRNKVHSAKIHELERELRNVRMGNDSMRGQIGPDGPLNDIPEDPYRGSQSDRNGYGYGGGSQGYGDGPDPYAQQPATDRPTDEILGNRKRRTYENEQHNVAHRHGGADGEPYWGFNRYYNPQYVTAYRREHVPYHAKRDATDEQTQYADDFNHLQEMQRRQEEEWRRKKHEEDSKLMRDINKYFHDSKFMDERPEPKPDDYYFNDDIPYHHPHTAYTTYERVYVSPRSGDLVQKQPGGLYIMRFHDSGYDEVNVSLKEQQTIIKSFHGHVLGVARKQNVIVIEGDAEWRFSRHQAPRPQIAVRHKNVEDAIAVLWFPSRDKAFDFFSNSFRNRFKQQGFPTPHGWEGHYVPLLTPPFLKMLDTYLVIEMLNIGNVNQEKQQNLQEFEREARQEILRLAPNSMPFVISAMKGRDAFKPGPMFRDRSKVFVSRFNSLSELADLWSRGVIQGLLQKWRLTAPLNVSAFSLKDWQDN